MLLHGDTIIEGIDTIQREHLEDGDNVKIASYINRSPMFAPTMESRDNVFHKIELANVQSRSYLIQNSKGQRVEVLSTYNEDGEQDEEGWFYYQDSILTELRTEYTDIWDGEKKLYYDNGQVAQSSNLTEGMRNGAWKHYYPNGQLYESGTYSNNQKSGEWIKYDRQGAVKETETHQKQK